MLDPKWLGQNVTYHAPGGFRRPAIVTSVGQDVVGLCVFSPIGLHFMQAVPFAAGPKEGHWTAIEGPPLVPSPAHEPEVED